MRWIRSPSEPPPDPSAPGPLPCDISHTGAGPFDAVFPFRGVFFSFAPWPGACLSTPDMIGWRQASGPKIVCIGGISMKCGRLLPLLLSLLLSVSLLAPAALAGRLSSSRTSRSRSPPRPRTGAPPDPSSFDAARQALLTAVRGEDASERSVLSLLSRMTDRFNRAAHRVLLLLPGLYALPRLLAPRSMSVTAPSAVRRRATTSPPSQEVLNSAYGSVLAWAAWGRGRSVPPVHLPQYAGGAGPAGA